MINFANKAPELVPVKGGFRGRFRCGPGSRPYAVLRFAKKDQAEARAARMRSVLDSLVDAKLYGSALSFLQDMANAPNERAFAGIERAARTLLAEEPARATESPAFNTFRKIALGLIDGSLRKEYPDCGVKALLNPIRPRTAETLKTNLNRVDALIGGLHVGAITAEHCAKVKKHLADSGYEHGTRRNTQLLVRTVLGLAKKPLKLIADLPIDGDWVIPKANRSRAFQYLHPTEEAALMRCVKIPLLYRLLWAFFCRNGGRKEETLALTWGDITLATGKCNLDETKTKYPRWWHMDADVARALAAIKPPGATANDKVFAGIRGNHLEKKLREHLVLAQLVEARPELMKNTGTRRWLCVHDLRATFCTVAMATGWTEFDIMCRTGHCTSTELQKYRRDVAELEKMGMIWFHPLDDLLGVEPRQVAHGVAQRGKFTVIKGGLPRSQGTERQLSRGLEGSKSAGKRTGATRSVGHRPPPKGGVAQKHGPPPSAGLIAAIAAAATAGKWDLAERLEARLESESSRDDSPARRRR